MAPSKLLLLVGTAAATAAAGAVGFLPINPAGAEVGAQQVGICTGCPTPSTTAPPPMATTTTTAAPAATTTTAAPKPPVKVSAAMTRTAVVPTPKPLKKGAKAPSGKFSGIVSVDSLSWTVNTVNASPLVRIRLREGAPGKNGPIIIALGAVEGADSDIIALSDVQEAKLRTARFYVEAVSNASPNGEMRGQVR